MFGFSKPSRRQKPVRNTKVSLRVETLENRELMSATAFTATDLTFVQSQSENTLVRFDVLAPNKGGDVEAGNNGEKAPTGPTPTTGGLQAINSMPDQRVRTKTLELYQDGNISRNDLLDLYHHASVGYTNLSISAQTSLMVLTGTNAARELRIPEYARQLATKVSFEVHNFLYPSPGTTPPVGNSLAEILKKGVDNHFLGQDRPLPMDGYTYTVAHGPLWEGAHPSAADVKSLYPAELNWFHVGLAEVAYNNPTAIERLFIDNGDNTYTVKVHHYANRNFFGGSDYVTVDRHLLQKNGAFYSGGNALWVQLYMKAYVQANGEGLLGSLKPGIKSYDAIEFDASGPESEALARPIGNPAWVFGSIIGYGSTYLQCDQQPLKFIRPQWHYNLGGSVGAIADAWSAGQYVSLKVGPDADKRLGGGDEVQARLNAKWYALVNYVPDASTHGRFTITNNGQTFYEVTGNQMADHFDMYSASTEYYGPVSRTAAFPQLNRDVDRIGEPLPWLASNTAQFTDQDGDTYTVKLAGPGQIYVQIDDADGNGKGPISQIIVQGTDPLKSSLAVSVRKASTGDGMVTIGAIDATALKSISATASDLLGSIHVHGLLGSLTIRNVNSGAVVQAEGLSTQATKLTANVIADDAALRFGSTLSAFKATTVGAADIAAAAIGTLTTKGDFNADLKLNGSPAAVDLKSATIGGGIADAVWSIIGDVGTLTVKGDASDWALSIHGGLKKGTFGNMDDVSLAVQHSVQSIAVKSFLNSDLYMGQIPTATNPVGLVLGPPPAFVRAVLGSFKATSFANSNISAPVIGKVALQSVQADNNGLKFGVRAQESIAAVTAKNLAFAFNPKLTTPQGVDDFEVNVL